MFTPRSMEHRLAKVSDKEGDGEDKEVAEMRRKLQAAKLVSRHAPMVATLVTIEIEQLCFANLMQDDRFYDDLGDEEDDEVSELDRKGRFTQAYNVALSTDTQGYCVPTGSKLDRTPQELTAISWAAFCTNVSLKGCYIGRVLISALHEPLEI